MTSKLCHPFLTSHNKIILASILDVQSLRADQKTETFSELVNRTVEKLQPWKTRHISKAGRVVLIQANVQSMPTHTMQCFQLPKDTNQQIDKISRDFFWKKSNENKGLPMVSWDKICRSKKVRRLGLRKMEVVNSAFLGGANASKISA